MVGAEICLRPNGRFGECGGMDGAPDAAMVARLIDEQCPWLIGAPVVPSPAAGSSNWVFRLGADRAIRMPRSDGDVASLVKEARWLPMLGARLPVAVPEVLFEGAPSGVFPRPWLVVSWVPGERPADLSASGELRLAQTLGSFVRRLHEVPAIGLEPGAATWGYRAGEPVTDEIDGWAEEAADELADLFDPTAVREAWRRVRDVPPASGAPCWLHTDLSSENVLVWPDGDLAGVIDFGGLGVGDRSVDLLYAWSLFREPAREAFREATGADEATWLRARAWAFVGPGLLTIAHYRDSMPERTARLTAMVEAIAAEVGVALR